MCENRSSQEVVLQPREDSKETEVAAARSGLKSGCWKTRRGLLTWHRAVQTLASLCSLGPAGTLQAARLLLLSPPCIRRGEIPPHRGSLGWMQRASHIQLSTWGSPSALHWRRKLISAPHPWWTCVFMGKCVFSSLNDSSSSLKHGENITYLLSFGLFQGWNEILHLDGLKPSRACWI